ncbi:MAG: hypothetical protein EBR59_00705 [Methylococcaceae bacterium]|nr:hypothetical protein [Methylococcaceae bacterium]
MQQSVFVTRVEPGHIWVRSEAASACSACSQRTHCGTSSISLLLPVRELKLPCQDSFCPGDRLILSIDDKAVLGGAVLLYALPLVLMLLVTSIWDLLLPAWSLWLPLIALLSLVGSFWYLKQKLRQIICPVPQIVARLSESTQVSDCHSGLTTDG